MTSVFIQLTLYFQLIQTNQGFTNQTVSIFYLKNRLTLKTFVLLISNKLIVFTSLDKIVGISETKSYLVFSIT